MKLIELKSEKFIYCGKTYNERKFISEDKKVYITFDKFFGVKIYNGLNTGIASICFGNIGCWSIKAAIKLVTKDINKFEYGINIHPSYYNKKIKLLDSETILL